jgi:hypothetical protein
VRSAARSARSALEHLWVEAAIDFLPSRGARNLDADSWTTGFDASLMNNAQTEAKWRLQYRKLLFNGKRNQLCAV